MKKPLIYSGQSPHQITGDYAAKADAKRNAAKAKVSTGLFNAARWEKSESEITDLRLADYALA